jgi:hypothetical protein
MMNADQVLDVLEEFQMQLLGERLIILPMQESTYVEGGLIERPDSHQSAPHVGQIIGFGKDVPQDMVEDLFRCWTTFSGPMADVVSLDMRGHEPFDLFLLHLKDLRLYWPEDDDD